MHVTRSLVAALHLSIAACASAPTASTPGSQAEPIALGQAPAASSGDDGGEAGMPRLLVEVGVAPPALDQLVWYRGDPPAAGTRYGIYWWGTFCHPCKVILPALMARADAEGLPLVAVSRDSEERLDGFFAEHVGAFPERVAYDPIPSPVAKAHGAWVLPSLVVVGPDGLVERVIVGARDIKAWMAPAEARAAGPGGG